MNQPEILNEKIRKTMVKAISRYSMIQDGDRILLAVSGGKDSTIMALMFRDIAIKSPVSFTYEAVILDQKQPGFNVETYQDWMMQQGVPLTIITEDTYSIVKEKVPVGKTTCGLCSRLRRGILYNYAHEHGFDKIALGHHRDDLNETLLLNIFYTGQLGSMPPKLISDDKRNTVIRPLCEVSEKDLTDLSQSLNIPVIPCNLCGSQENLKRKKIKKLLKTLEADHPELQSSMIKAQRNIKASQLSDLNFLSFD